MRKILGPMRRAILEHRLIEKGDKVAVGVSGGKDSLVLLCALSEYRKYNDSDFQLIAITVDQTNGKTNFEELSLLCAKLDVPFFVVKTNIFEVVFDERKEKNPCSLCAKMRRGSLNAFAKEQGCNKVALAHHKDDMIETFFLSLFYEGRISTFLPKTYLSNTDLHVIRPFIHVDEHTLASTAVNLNLPVIHNSCPANKKTQREEIKKLFTTLEKDFPGSKELVYTAVIHGERINLPGVTKVETDVARK